VQAVAARTIQRWITAASRHEEIRAGNPRTKKAIAVDPQRNTLAEAKTFGRWCVGRRYLRANPVENVKGVGRRRHGKAQLRIDEARRWMARAVELADQGEDGQGVGVG
jgi:hypothetical protein